jgi:hypothetical protein
VEHDEAIREAIMAHVAASREYTTSRLKSIRKRFQEASGDLLRFVVGIFETPDEVIESASKKIKVVVRRNQRAD